MKPGAIWARNVLTVGQRLEIFLEHGASHSLGYASRIEDMVDDELIVALPFDENGAPVIPHEGENIYVHAAGDGCHYRFLTVHHKHSWYQGRVPVLHLALPQSAEKFQKRGMFRVKVDFKVGVQILDEKKEEKSAFHQAKSLVPAIDLSADGLAFVWTNEIARGMTTLLKLDNLPEIGTLDLRAEVMRSTCVYQGEKRSIFHIGAKFQDITRGVQEQIIRYLFQLQFRELARLNCSSAMTAHRRRRRSF